MPRHTISTGMTSRHFFALDGSCRKLVPSRWRPGSMMPSFHPLKDFAWSFRQWRGERRRSAILAAPLELIRRGSGEYRCWASRDIALAACPRARACFLPSDALRLRTPSSSPAVTPLSSAPRAWRRKARVSSGLSKALFNVLKSFRAKKRFPLGVKILTFAGL
jgi:hypothetical protein